MRRLPVRLPEPRLLLVTDRAQARAPLAAIVEAALAGGCRWLSLREKNLPETEQVALARELHAIGRRHGAIVALHGSARLAAEAGLDGVHLSAGSDPAAARALLGPDALIGLSVHSPGEAAGADPALIDYVVAGPAFETASKPGYGPALGEAGVAAIAQVSAVPVIAIGGIDPGNAARVLAAGAAGLAVMGGIMRAADPAQEVSALLAAMAVTIPGSAG